MDPTPRPWRIDQSDPFVFVIQDGTDGEAICTMGGLPEMFANAELIVAAVNNYSEAREAAFSKLAEAAQLTLDRLDRENAEFHELREALKAVEAASK